MLRIINLILVLGVLGNAFYLVSERYTARQQYMKLSQLQVKTETINKEYTRLQLEEGTYSSDLAVQDYALHNLGLIQADKQHLMEIN